MDLRQKVTEALRRSLQPEYIRLEEDGGISGFVVAARFRGMSAIDRQTLIAKALREASPALTKAELRQVLAIAALTPAEYDAVGGRIHVHRIKEIGGAFEVIVHGRLADAEHVREALNSAKGVTTTEPKQLPGAVGILMSFRATGSEAHPLTRAKIVDLLNKDPQIEILPNG